MPKVWHSKDKYRRAVYRCNHKYGGGHKCLTPNLGEDEIKAAFMQAVGESGRKFDRKRWCREVENVRVLADGRLEFNFKEGESVTTKIAK